MPLVGLTVSAANPDSINREQPGTVMAARSRVLNAHQAVMAKAAK